MFQPLDGPIPVLDGDVPSFQTVTEINTWLEAASRRFEELFQGLPVACFCFDTFGRILEWNRSSEALFRQPAGSALQQPAWEVVGTRDGHRLRTLIQSVLGGAAYEDLEWSEAGDDGKTRHFLSNMFPLRAPDGEIIGGISASIDITTRRAAESALRESEERWHLAVLGTNDGIWDWNVRNGAAFFSTRWKQILGHEDEEVGTSREEWSARLHPDDAPAVLAAFQSHLDGRTEFFTAEYRVRCRNGSYKWVLDRGQALWDSEGAAVRIAGSFTDITDRKRAEQQIQEANTLLETLATEDGLTGLKNHRAFQERLAMEFGRAPRYHTPLSLVLLDVDEFKKFNDAFGHPAGDVVLQKVAGLLSQCVRETDLVGRYGGEEYVLILPHTDGDGARTVAERCRAAIASAPWPFRRVTASFGIATLEPSLRTPAELVGAADRALYAAKSRGRNLVLHVGDKAVASSRRPRARRKIPAAA